MVAILSQGVPISGVGSSVRPRGDRNHKHGHAVRSVAVFNKRRAGQICTPCSSLRGWKEEHQVRMPVAVTIAQVGLS